MELKQKPSGIYFIDTVSNDGKRQRISLDTREPKEAREQFRQWKLGVHPKQCLPARPAPNGSVKSKKVLTLGQGLDKCLETVWAMVKSRDSMRSRAKILTARYGDTPVTDIDLLWLEGVVADFRAQGSAEGSIKRMMESISKVLVMALEWKNPETGKPWLDKRPKFPSLKVRNFKDRVLSHSEETKAFAAIEKRRIAEPSRNWWRFGKLIRFLLDTGLRLGEALSIGEADLTAGLQGNRLIYYVGLRRYETKSDKPRQVPLSDAVVEDLPALTAQQVEGRFFPLLPSMAWYMWDQIRKDVDGLGDVRLHSLRHTCATRLVKGVPEKGIPGLDIYRLKEWLGHSDIKITVERYAHLTPPDLAGGLDVLNSNTGLEQERFRNTDIHSKGTSKNTETNCANSDALCQ